MKYYLINNNFFNNYGIYKLVYDADNDLVYKLVKDVTQQRTPRSGVWITPSKYISKKFIDNEAYDWSVKEMNKKEVFIELL